MSRVEDWTRGSKDLYFQLLNADILGALSLKEFQLLKRLSTAYFKGPELELPDGFE